MSDLSKCKTEAQLTKAYEAWCKKKGYAFISADELFHELIGREERPFSDVAWLEDFMDRWEKVVNPKPILPKGCIKPADHWAKEITKLRCWITGFKAGRGEDFIGSIPGEDVLRQIEIALKDAKA